MAARPASPASSRSPSHDDGDNVGRSNEQPEEEEEEDHGVCDDHDDVDGDVDEDENSALNPPAGPLRGACPVPSNVFADAAVASEAMKMLVRIYLGQLKRCESEEALRGQGMAGQRMAATKPATAMDKRVVAALMADIVSEGPGICPQSFYR